MAYGRPIAIIKMTSNFRQAVGYYVRVWKFHVITIFLIFLSKLALLFLQESFLVYTTSGNLYCSKKELNQHKIVAITSNLVHVAEVCR